MGSCQSSLWNPSIPSPCNWHEIQGNSFPSQPPGGLASAISDQQAIAPQSPWPNSLSNSGPLHCCSRSLRMAFEGLSWPHSSLKPLSLTHPLFCIIPAFPTVHVFLNLLNFSSIASESSPELLESKIISVLLKTVMLKAGREVPHAWWHSWRLTGLSSLVLSKSWSTSVPQPFCAHLGLIFL